MSCVNVEVCEVNDYSQYMLGMHRYYMDIYIIDMIKIINML